ncbi:transporter substrate-binding domain-containing protein [Pseudomonas sp. JQ170]|uniref:transporter substrate-binding domain-containing protein n=1 Tax=unclassified Pseudomonas TaxID=196821 RepID=UPI00264E36F8|nr:MULTISPECIES: transporter substrate-binding domain-containing protein [unclassified Pseudomonas]MDN7140939.1 transporter substrate-binding domain-containing protein [Pseudomonas sp. JQ170]WRO74962.1 transporter substrate-binding domain-containing protein [Pseudomonas sp. 170C]
MQRYSNHYKSLSGFFAVVLMNLAPLVAQADQWAEVKKAGELVIGTEMQFAPFDYLEKGQQQGFNPALFKLIGEKLGVKVRFLDLPWAGVLPGLEASKFDLVGGPLIITQARKERYSYTLPVAEATVALMVRANDGSIKKPADIAGKVVGAGKGSAMLEDLKSFAATLPEPVTIREYVDNNQAYADLSAGRIAAVANSLPNISFIASQRSQVFKVVQPPFGKPSYFAYVGRKGEDSNSLIAEINQALLKLHDDGRLAALQKQWLGAEMPVPTTEVHPSW